MRRVIIHCRRNDVLRNDGLTIDRRRFPGPEIVLADMFVIIPELLGGAVNLLMKTPPSFVARLIIKTPVASRPIELRLLGCHFFYQALLLLEQSEEKSRIDLMVLRCPENKFRCRNALTGIEQHKIIAQIASFRFKETLNIGLAHGL